MLREMFKWKPHEDPSTDARHRGGVARSGDEGAVMALERRRNTVWLYRKVNRQREDPLGKAKPFDIPKRVVWEAY